MAKYLVLGGYGAGKPSELVFVAWDLHLHTEYCLPLAHKPCLWSSKVDKGVVVVVTLAVTVLGK